MLICCLRCLLTVDVNCVFTAHPAELFEGELPG
jgi:hypothetical protein